MVPKMGPKIGTRFGSANAFTIKTAKSGPYLGATKKGPKMGPGIARKMRKRAKKNATMRKQAWSKKRSKFVQRRLGSRSSPNVQ